MDPVQDQPQQNIPVEPQTASLAEPPPQEPPSQTPSQTPPPLISPIKKFLPFIVIGIVVLVLLTGAFALFAGKSSKETATPTPTVRPTATPIAVPTLPENSPTPKQATVSSEIKNKLVFIKDGDIYESDLFSFTLLVKNKTAAGDKLAWSPKGNFLAFRPKSTTGTPDTVTVYDRHNQSSWSINPPAGGQNVELVDYAWSPDEKQLAILYRDNAYNISLVTNASSSAVPTNLVTQTESIKQILWPTDKTLIFSGKEGISSLNTGSPSASLLVSNKSVQSIRLSPTAGKILYSVGTENKSDLYLVNLDGNFNQLLKTDPNKIDMGTTGVDKSILDNGFIPYALFFPQGDRLLVGFHYLTGLPLVGIYDLKDKSFKAIAPFLLSASDILIHDLLLLGPRVITNAGQSSWQVSLYTMEKGAKLGMIRAIPGASSPAYFGTYQDKQ